MGTWRGESGMVDGGDPSGLPGKRERKRAPKTATRGENFLSLLLRLQNKWKREGEEAGV